MYRQTQFPQRDTVLLSYSHLDKIWLEKFQTMLKPMVKNQGISVWDDTQITPGAVRDLEINQALKSAKVAVLLVSANFLASDFIYEQELLPLFKAASQEGVIIMWVYLSACMYEETEVAKYQPVHDISKPINSLDPSEQEQVILYICQQIKSAVNSKFSSINSLSVEHNQVDLMYQRLLKAKRYQDIRTLRFEAEEYLVQQPYNVDARILMDKIEQAERAAIVPITTNQTSIKSSSGGGISLLAVILCFALIVATISLVIYLIISLL